MKSSANSNFCRELSQEIPIAQLCPVRQHYRGGVEDEHGLVHYADIGYNYNLPNNQLLSKCVDSSGSENLSYSLSTNSVYAHNSSSMIPLDDVSISDNDLSKNTLLKASGQRGKTRGSKISAFSQAALQEFLSSSGQAKVKECHREANARMAVVNTAVRKRMPQKEIISAFSEGALRKFLTPASRFKLEEYPLEQMQLPSLYMYK